MPVTIATSTIVAEAFLAMEKSPIASFGDDSDEAMLTALHYPDALDTCLSAGDWSFASVYVELPQEIPGDGVATDPTLPYLYALPGDVLRLVEVPAGIRWRRDRDGIRANCPAPLPLRYTARLDSEASMPAIFRSAVALHLAAILGPRFLGTQGKMEVIKRDAEMALKRALREDSRTASEARYDGLAHQDDWVTEARW